MKYNLHKYKMLLEFNYNYNVDYKKPSKLLLDEDEEQTDTEKKGVKLSDVNKETERNKEKDVEKRVDKEVEKVKTDKNKEISGIKTTIAKQYDNINKKFDEVLKDIDKKLGIAVNDIKKDTKEKSDQLNKKIEVIDSKTDKNSKKIEDVPVPSEMRRQNTIKKNNNIAVSDFYKKKYNDNKEDVSYDNNGIKTVRDEDGKKYYVADVDEVAKNYNRFDIEKELGLDNIRYFNSKYNSGY